MRLEEYLDSLKGKRIAVVGIGVSNRPLIELLLRAGCDVTACDRNSRGSLGDTVARFEAMGAKLRLGEDYISGLDADIIFRTPGMHPKVLEEYKKHGVVITSEMELFFALCPCKIIAVTGSDGKTTTTTVISLMLKEAGFTVHVGGNIGTPLLSFVSDMRPEDYVVLELSSFQLHSMHCRPDVAVITNITPNHLDVHPDMDDYVNAKRQIFLNQDINCKLVLNLDDPISSGLGGETKGRLAYFSRREIPRNGAFNRDGTIYYVRDGIEVEIMSVGDIKIPGVHNIENYMAAFAALDGLVPTECMTSVAVNFAGVAHRLELIRELRGVRYYNDSIASSPTRTIAGLRSFIDKPILIAGGYDKRIPFDELGAVIADRVKTLFLTGDTAESIKKAVESAPAYSYGNPPITVIDDFKDAVLAAHNVAKLGDTVLLSPACASFDKFKNFEQRGDYFREIVSELD